MSHVRVFLAALVVGGFVSNSVYAQGAIAGTVTELMSVGRAQMQQGNITAYGGLVADMAFEIDGMNIMSMFGTGSTPGFYQNMGAYEEVSYQVVAGSAESNTGGVKVNLIPKAGGNRFTGELQTYFSNEDLQGDNTTDELLRRGLTAPPALNKLYDVNGSVGGPIKRDRLWFFESYRVWAYNPYVLNIYNADGSPFVDWNRNQVITTRVTAQLDARNKITAMYDRNPRLRYYFVLTPGLTEPSGAPEQQFVNTFTTQAKWTSTVSNRLLVPARRFDQIDDMPNNKNFAPRFGAAFDVFGNGRTAIKGSLGRYMEQIGQSFASRYNPMVSSTASVAWTDLNNDDVAQDQPGCVYLAPGSTRVSPTVRA
jgi:hypothetical protein